MKLTELEPQSLARTDDDAWHNVDTQAEADGIMFLCPQCFHDHGGDEGTHPVVCWQPHVPKTTSPGPGRWTMTGAGFHDLTLAPSVNVKGCWHGFIKNGEATL